MKCPNCSTNNRDEARFCKTCGEEFNFICPVCRHINDQDSLFCDDCGQRLNKAQKAEKVEPDIESERKHVTVLFSDLSGYTAMTEKLDPEEVKDIMTLIFGEIAQIITQYEGFIERFIGDAVMAVFGVPHTHEDDPLRAILAAKQIHKVVESKSLDFMNKIGHPLRMHTGINTGLVVTGKVDLEEGMHGMTGDAINLASRLEELAQPGEILIGHETYLQVKESFEFDILTPKKIKGKIKDIKTYRILEQKIGKTRFEISIERGLRPLIGRDFEINRLLNGFNQAAEGQGQVVSIVGEAGIGKSRLLSELIKRLTGNKYGFFTGHCLHYGDSINYLPFIEILRSYFDLNEGDQEFIVKKKMDNISKYLKNDVPSLMDLLSLHIEDKNYNALGVQQKRVKLFEALKNLLVWASHEHPLIIAIEDMHWIDQTSEEFISYLIPFIRNSRILVILLYRPDYTHKWNNFSNYQQIGLSQLTDKYSIILLQALLGEGIISNQLEKFMIEKASGNPLFIEEFTHNMIESGSIKSGYKFELSKSISGSKIPGTIRGIISARIDRLGKKLKYTLQIAAVIGKSFSTRILNNVSGLNNGLKDNLLKLQKAEFIYEGKLFPEKEFIFKHSLTQEVAYKSLLLKKRQEIHARIGYAIESIYNERLEEWYETLAFHFEQGEVWDKSFEYHVKAGIKARYAYSIQSALKYFDYAKKLISEHDLIVNWRLHFDLLYERGTALIDIGHGIYAFGEFKEAEILAKQKGQPDLIFKAMFSEAWAAWFSHEISQMKTILEELESMVAHNADNLLGVVTQQVWCSFGLQDLNSVLHKENEMHDLFYQAQNSEFAPEATYNIGLFHRWRGDSDRCIEMIEPALPVLKASATPVSYLGATFHYGLALGEQGKYQQSIIVLEKGQKLGLESGEQYTTPKLTNSLVTFKSVGMK